jgi:hypothetical protein
MPINPITFLVSLAHENQPIAGPFIRVSPALLPTTCLDGYSQKSALATTPRHMGEQHRRYGNINPLSIAYATRLGLGPTNPGTIIVAQETLLLRWAGFSPALKLLIPAFSLPRAPPGLPARLHCPRNAPLPRMRLRAHIRIFGATLEPRYIFRAESQLTSELLRTL